MFLIKPCHHEAKQNNQNAPSPTAELHTEQAIHFAHSAEYNVVKATQGIWISLFKEHYNILNITKKYFHLVKY